MPPWTHPRSAPCLVPLPAWGRPARQQCRLHGHVLARLHRAAAVATAAAAAAASASPTSPTSPLPSRSGPTAVGRPHGSWRILWSGKHAAYTGSVSRACCKKNRSQIRSQECYISGVEFSRNVAFLAMNLATNCFCNRPQNVALETVSPSIRTVLPGWPIIPYPVHILLTDSVHMNRFTEPSIQLWAELDWLMRLFCWLSEIVPEMLKKSAKASSMINVCIILQNLVFQGLAETIQ